MSHGKATRLLLAAVLSFAFGSPANADVLNGRFDTGDLSGWTSFQTPTGTVSVGYPMVSLFDTTGAGQSNAATFYAGLASGQYGTADYQGGGIYQDVLLQAGVVTINLDFAAFNPRQSGLSNAEGGRFRILLDGSELAAHTIGIIDPQETIRGSLAGTAFVASAGLHEVRIEVTRNYYAGPNSTPAEYVDNISVSQVPEPASVTLLGTLTLLVTAWRARRKPNT